MNEKDHGRWSRLSSRDNSLRDTELTGVKLGQKHQVTIRLESATLESIEDIQESHGISFAEATRRIIRKGIRDTYE